MNRAALEPVHALEIATGAGALLVPSACIAEVVPAVEIALLPLAPPWVLGVMNWRSRPVAVISFERLSGAGPRDARPRAKLAVFYPPPGSRRWQFFAIPAAADPVPHLLDAGTVVPAGETADRPYIAAAVHLGDRLLAIPDLEALKKVLYPA
jgi:chemotaxis signal transduction protein